MEQKQLAILKEEKRLLQQQLQKEEDFSRCIVKQTNAASFTPQRINPVFLESLGSRIRAKSSLELPKKSAIKRDVGVMCSQHTRDIGTLASPGMVRSIGINSTNTNGIHDDLYTKQDLENFVQISIRNHEEKLDARKRQNSISIGTQMVPKSQVDIRHNFVQTSPIKEIETKSQGVMVYPLQKDAIIICKPEMRTIGSSDHKLTDIICDKCSAAKRTVACGPEVIEETKNTLSLKLMDMTPRSLSFSLGENEKLNIKRKTIGTQYQVSVQSKACQSSVEMDSIGIQNSVICVSKSTQYIVDSSPKCTDTNGLIKYIDHSINTDHVKLIDHSVNTDEIREKKVSKRDNFASTDVIKMKEIGLNTLPPAKLKDTSSNTDKISKKDVCCGDIIKPHISIACADNYCDSCKDAIKNLAKEFTKVLASPVLGSTSERTRIPRPTTITSPRPGRKPFVRQNTYTIPSPTLSSSPTIEQSPTSAITVKVLSGILDSVNLVESPTSASKKNDESPGRIDESEELLPSSSKEESLSSKKLEEKSWKEEDVSKSLINGGNESKEKSTPSLESSQDVKRNSMLLNQIATSISEPRTKTTPSKEIKAAMKVINDSLQKSTSDSGKLKSANSVVQNEWFQISSTDKANPLDVEDYLDCFEEYSNSLLKYMVNLIDTNGNTAMHYAVSHGNFDVVSILLDSKVCNVNQTNNAGYTCVMLVSLAKLKNSAHRTVVQRLFQMADVNIRAKKHCQTALMLAVSHGNLDMVEMLLSAGADINIQDEDGSTALMCAAEHGHIDIVKHLLSQPDCDSLIQDVDSSTAFKIAWQAGHRDIGLLLYVHEQMLRSKMPSSKLDQRSPATPRRQKQSTHHQLQ